MLRVSIVIPTYNRPDELARLLSCIAKQSYRDFECLIIDDGSSDDTQAQYNELCKSLDDRFRLHLKDKDDRKGGPGKARNAGIRLAAGAFIAFCDDDDIWIRDDHLSVAVNALMKHEGDVFIANMQTSWDGDIVEPDWFSVAPALFRNPISGEADLFEVSVTDIVKFLSRRTLHADMLVVEKRLLTEIGMYSEHQVFGEDYDIQLRLADKAKKMICRSTVVADLDVSRHASFSRDWDTLDRTLCTIFAALRAETAVFDQRLRRVARRNRSWMMLDVARLMLRQERKKEARELATQSFFLFPSFEALRIYGRALRAPDPTKACQT